MKVFLTRDVADKILEELQQVDHLFYILDHDLLSLDKETIDLIEERERLRREKRYDGADAIRKKLGEIFLIEDDKTGFTVIRKLPS